MTSRPMTSRDDSPVTRRPIFWLVLAAVAVLAYVLLINAWWSIGATARVIDAETKQPIPGAIVLANWELKGLEGWVLEQLEVHETLTSAEGRFSLPTLGPRLRWHGMVRADQPIVRVFHRGYLPAIVRNRQKGTWGKLLRQPSIDDQTIELQPFRGSPLQYVAELDRFAMSIGFLYSTGNCEWQRAPGTVLEMDGIKNEIQDGAAASRLVSVGEIADSPRCGSAREFFKGHVK